MNDLTLIYWPRSGRVSLVANSGAARAWLSEQWGPATPLQLARRAHDVGFTVGGTY